MKKTFGVAILSLAVLGACSTGGKPPENFGTKHYYNLTEKWPDWVTNPKKYAQKHKEAHYFAGLATNEPDFEVGREDAYAEALATLSQSIKDKIHTLFVSGRTTDFADHKAEIEKDIERGVIIESQAVATGVNVNKFEAKGFWYKTENGVEYGYDIAVLTEMSNDDYNKTVLLTLEKVKQHVKNPESKKVVSEMKKLYLKNDDN